MNIVNEFKNAVIGDMTGRKLVGVLFRDSDEWVTMAANGETFALLFTDPDVVEIIDAETGELYKY